MVAKIVHNLATAADDHSWPNPLVPSSSFHYIRFTTLLLTGSITDSAGLTTDAKSNKMTLKSTSFDVYRLIGIPADSST